MSFADSLQLWNQSVLDLEGGNVRSAIDNLNKIPEPSSKHYFNIGQAYRKLGKPLDAIEVTIY